MLLSKSALDTITKNLKRDIGNYGISLDDNASAMILQNVESMLAEQGILVEESVTLDDLNDTQHKSWMDIAYMNTPAECHDETNLEKVATALFNKYDGNQSAFKGTKTTRHMVDWRIPEGTPLESTEHDKPYTVNVEVGNQSFVEFIDSEKEPVMAVMIEVNHGTPMLHIELEGGDTLIHIHKTDKGLVFTPDCERTRFIDVPESDLIYPASNSRLIEK